MGKNMKQNKPTDVLVRGTLDMMIMRTVATSAKHGYSIAREIGLQSGGVLTVEEGSLYPALHRLEKKGLVSSHWERSENNRKAKFYLLTKDGAKQLIQKNQAWKRVSDAVTAVMSGTTVSSV